jgi:hypothetical protein
VTNLSAIAWTLKFCASRDHDIPFDGTVRKNKKDSNQDSFILRLGEPLKVQLSLDGNNEPHSKT